MDWKKYETVQYKIPSDTKQVKALAGFDLDSTLIISDRGELFATKGWLWAYDKIPEILKSINDKGYTIVIFSNRKVRGHLIENTMSMIDQIINTLQLPIYVFLATADDQYRKPNIGMFNLFKQLTGTISLDSNSIYCGDAAGTNALNPAFRWSDADIKFAHNTGLKFLLPTDLFPTFIPVIPENIKLLITMGHGWENMFIPDTTNNMTDGRLYVVLKIPHLYKQGEIQLIIGENADYYTRNSFREKAGVSQNDTLILYYPNYGQIKAANKYPKIERNEHFTRVN